MIDTAKQMLKAIERTDTDAFAWLFGLEDTHGFEADDARDFIIAALKEYIAKGLPTKAQIEFAIDHCEPEFMEGLTTEREFWIADNMRGAILDKVRKLRVDG